ncbi:MAG TPA: NAD(P)/FAD-dependent oxidoreductase [Candidatus Dormibacteraeota bacterium]|nr:NAD(P)/FAD-dependent oxidoreductase [Candidatus Dormibacteraeota bacterium]
MEEPTGARPSVVIVGAGFAGLRLARGLSRAPVDVTILDRHNYHTFVPLLYQVATAGLEPEEIAQPIRHILRGVPNARFRLNTVIGVDLGRRAVITDAGEVRYDYLVLAAGSTTNYFGQDLAQVTSALRDLDDAERLRDQVLGTFEAASAEEDAARCRQLMTLIVVGGGPTGVELAGALAELQRHVLPHDYPDLDLSSARILLLEATDRILPGMPKALQGKAQAKLSELGVEIRFGAPVADADADGVTLRGGERIAAGAVVWVAGMLAPPLADVVPTPKGVGGRLVVEKTLQLPDRRGVYAIGDMAHVGGLNTQPHPMLAPVAIQQANLVAESILRSLAGKRPKRFIYRDRGTMVTIGRNAAVAHIFRLRLSGFIAWLIWLTVHLVWLIGFRNRMLVLVNWAWNYLTYDRGVRLIRRASSRQHVSNDNEEAP